MSLPSPVPTESSGKLTGTICLNTFPKESQSAARPVMLARPSSPPVNMFCWTLQPGEVTNYRKQNYLQYLISIWALPVPHFPVCSCKGQMWYMPIAGVVRHHEALTTQWSFPEQLVSPPCTTMLTYGQKVYTALNSHRTPWRTAWITTAWSPLQCSQHRHTSISDGIRRG